MLTLSVYNPSPCNKQRVSSQKIYPVHQSRIVCRNPVQVQEQKLSSLSFNPLRELVMNKKGCGFGAVCHAGPLTPRNLQWISTISTAVLMLARGTSIHRSFLAPLFALQAPASIVSWIKGEYGIWTAFLALLVRLFFFIPGELELPFTTLLLVILAPNQIMSRLRGTQEGIILTVIIAAYLAFQHFSRTGSLARAFDQEVGVGKRQDDLESDVGELSSPASQDHYRQQNILTDGEEEEIEKEESCSTVPSVEALKNDDSEEPNIVREDEYDGPLKKSKDVGSSDSSGGSKSSSSYIESNGINITRNADVSPDHDSVKAAAVPERLAETLHSDTIEEADLCYPVEKSADCRIVESVLNENEEEKINPIEHKVYSLASIDAASESKEEESTSQVIENTTISDPKEFETRESGDRMTQSYSPAGSQDSAVSEPFLAPASHPEKTSWKSCCGLFEAFARSER